MLTAAWLAVTRRIRATFPLTRLLNLLLWLLKVKPSPLQLAITVAPLLALHLQTIHHRSSIPIGLSPHFPTLLPVTSVLTRLQVPPLVLSAVRPPEECFAGRKKKQLRGFRVYLYPTKDGPRNRPCLPKSY